MSYSMDDPKWQKLLKPVGVVVAAALVVTVGWYGYKKLIVEPKEKKAEAAIATAQQYFAVDSFNTALNGDGMNKGFLAVEKSFSGTQVGNLAKYYAGVCYLQTGNFAKAVSELKSFNTDSKPVQMMAYGALGDAYSEQKSNSAAIDSYKKAAETFPDDEANASEYLFRAAALSEVTGNTKGAVALYKDLKEKFPNTQRGAAADKYIYRLSIEPND